MCLTPIATHNGAFPILCHNNVKDLTARLLSKVCHDVQVKAHLQPLCGEVLCHCFTLVEDNTRVHGYPAFGDVQIIAKAFFNVRVFNSFAATLIAPQLLLQIFVSMRVRSTMPMRNTLAKLSMAASPPLVFLALVMMQ